MPGSEKVKVLIVDDIAETRENIRKLLQFEADVEVVGAARTGKEAIEYSMELKPDVVLMDINMPDMDGITATETIRRKLPYVQIVILSVQSDSNYMRRAMLAGARDFLTKPPMIDELTAAVRRAGRMAQEEKAKQTSSAPGSNQGGSYTSTQLPAHLGRIIVICGSKGGIGRTTIATNLAITLRTGDDVKVCLVDGSLQSGDINVFLNEQTKNTILDLATRSEELDPEIVNDVITIHSSSRIHILAAPISPEYADRVTGDQFAKVLQYLKQLYAFVVVDTSAYLTDVVLAAIDVSDSIVLITTQDIPAIKNIRSFLSLMDGMKVDRKKIVFIMNKFDKRIAISSEKVGENLKQAIDLTIPLDERTVLASVNRGVPFMIENRLQPVGKSMINLAEVIKDNIAKLEAAEKLA